MRHVIDVLICLVSGWGLWFSTLRFVSSCETCAQYLGLSASAAGALLIAVLTSVPELVVTIQASLMGEYSMAFGNIVGSVWANTCLILGVLAIIRPVRIELKHLNLDQIIHMLLILIVMVGVYIGASWVLLACVMLAVYGVYCVRQLPSLQETTYKTDQVDVQFSGRVLIEMLLYAMMLLLSAYGLILGASGLASWLGMTPYWIGLTVVALGTSLPEFSAALVSHHRGRDAWVLGNALGSNVFLLAVVLPMMMMFSPVVMQGEWLLELSLMGLMFVIVFGALRYFDRGCWAINRIEGAFLVLMYLGYLFLNI